MKRYSLYLIICLMAALDIVSCTDADNDYVHVHGISLNTNEHIMDIGDSFCLEASVVPDNAENKSVIWLSEDSNIASVNEHGVVTACSKGDTKIVATTEDGGFSAECTVTVRPERDVYAVGTVTDIATKKVWGVCWKNGVEIYRLKLTNPEWFGVADDVYVDDNGDIYICGYECQVEGTNIAYIYKNGEILYELTEQGKLGFAPELTIADDGSLYTVGYEHISYSTSTGSVWKDGGLLFTYGDNTTTLVTNSIHVKNSDVYVAGYYIEQETYKIPFYYKNEDKVELLPKLDGNGYPTFSEANDIFVTDNGDIYVTGHSISEKGYENVTVWKNGIPEYWGTPNYSSTSYEIAVCEGKVYVCGMDSIYAAYWIDGVKYQLNDRFSRYLDMEIVDGNVYTGGIAMTEDDTFKGCIWRNGNLLYEMAEDGWSMTVYGLFVK